MCIFNKFLSKVCNNNNLSFICYFNSDSLVKIVIVIKSFKVMKKKLFSLFCLLFFSCLSFGQVKRQESKNTVSKNEKQTEVCDFKPHLTEVYIIQGSVESTDVKPRRLTDDEKCLVEQKRKENEVVILQLDTYTEVRILPKSKIKE
jgi:hypothetical protein